MSRLDGKVAIVTGAGGGQGAAEARLLTELGAKVVATDINLEAVQKVVAQIEEVAPAHALALRHDVSSREDWTRVVAETVAAFGPVTVLVNNAGVYQRLPYEAVTLEQWQFTMNINAWGTFAGIQAVTPSMRDAGGGSIINIASVAAVNAVGGLSAYTASKGAIDAFSRGAAIELAPLNIRVNCVHPGVIPTAMIEANFPTPQAQAAAASAIPLQRLGRPVDVAYLVAYLASDESWFTTGTSQIIDGGITVEGGVGILRERLKAVM